MTVETEPKKAKLPKREVHSSECHMEQPSDIITPADQPFERPEPVIEKLHGIPVTTDYLAELAFMEEPVTVHFTPSSEKFAPPFVDGFNNGKGIEAFLNNRWIEVKQVPVGMDVMIKRKYLEIFARAKEIAIRADYTEVPGDDPVNRILRSVVLKHPFAVVQDSEKGREWLRAVLADR